MPPQAPRCLMMYIEPTSYVMSFASKMRAAMQDRVSVLFIATDRSQAWNIGVPGQWCEVLPPGRLRAAARLSWWVSPKRCAVLHLAGWGHPLLLLAMFLATVRRIPIFLESDTQLALREPRWKKAIKGLLYPVMFALPFRLLPGGSRQAAYMRHYGARQERILVARMTVDVTTIAREVELRRDRRAAIRARLGLRGDDVAFLYAGRLTRSKGIEVLVQAFLGAASRHPGAVLVVAGEGDARGCVETAASACDRIVLAGRKDFDELLDFYAAADALVVPSLFEPWGLVVNEGMAAGLPIIATEAVGAADDLVRHGVNGIRVDPGDATALEGAIEKLVAEPEARRRMGRASRELIGGWTQEGKAERVASAWRAALAGAVA